MHNKLEEIVLQKRNEIATLKKMVGKNPMHPITQILDHKIKYHPTKNFKKALRGNSLAIIAEIKRKSPSRGQLADIPDPVQLAQEYIAAGANALSILTDEPFFGGKLEELISVSQAIKDKVQPILRKDFLLDEIQIAESIAAGANAVLFIVAILGDQTKPMLQIAKDFGIDVLVEVHDAAELDIAFESGAEIIGVNNRDLKSFKVDVDRAFELVDSIPSSIIKVAESGITKPELAHQYYQAGFDAVLIGEALVKSNQPELFIKACQNGTFIN